MTINYCDACSGAGRIYEPREKWWQFWVERYSRTCEGCGGDGRAKPPGWPDKVYRLPPPSPPPPAKRLPTHIVRFESTPPGVRNPYEEWIQQAELSAQVVVCFCCQEITGEPWELLQEAGWRIVHFNHDVYRLCPKCKETLQKDLDT